MATPAARSAARHLQCPICMDVVRDAVACPEQHALCAACHNALPAGKRNCPQCRLAFAKRPPPLRLARALVDDLEVSCDRRDDGCVAVVRLGDLASHHATTCEGAKVVCSAGCGQRVPRRLAAAHAAGCCDTKGQCSRCMLPLARDGLAHTAAACLQATVAHAAALAAAARSGAETHADLRLDALASRLDAQEDTASRTERQLRRALAAVQGEVKLLRTAVADVLRAVTDANAQSEAATSIAGAATESAAAAETSAANAAAVAAEAVAEASAARAAATSANATADRAKTAAREAASVAAGASAAASGATVIALSVHSHPVARTSDAARFPSMQRTQARTSYKCRLCSGVYRPATAGGWRCVLGCQYDVCDACTAPAPLLSVMAVDTAAESKSGSLQHALIPSAPTAADVDSGSTRRRGTTKKRVAVILTENVLQAAHEESAQPPSGANEDALEAEDKAVTSNGTAVLAAATRRVPAAHGRNQINLFDGWEDDAELRGGSATLARSSRRLVSDSSSSLLPLHLSDNDDALSSESEDGDFWESMQHRARVRERHRHAAAQGTQQRTDSAAQLPATLDALFETVDSERELRRGDAVILAPHAREGAADASDDDKCLRLNEVGVVEGIQDTGLGQRVQVRSAAGVLQWYSDGALHRLAQPGDLVHESIALAHLPVKRGLDWCVTGFGGFQPRCRRRNRREGSTGKG